MVLASESDASVVEPRSKGIGADADAKTGAGSDVKKGGATDAKTVEGADVKTDKSIYIDMEIKLKTDASNDKKGEG